MRVSHMAMQWPRDRNGTCRNAGCIRSGRRWWRWCSLLITTRPALKAVNFLGVKFPLHLPFSIMPYWISFGSQLQFQLSDLSARARPVSTNLMPPPCQVQRQGWQYVWPQLEANFGWIKSANAHLIILSSILIWSQKFWELTWICKVLSLPSFAAGLLRSSVAGGDAVGLGFMVEKWGIWVPAVWVSYLSKARE